MGESWCSASGCISASLQPPQEITAVLGQRKCFSSFRPPFPNAHFIAAVRMVRSPSPDVPTIVRKCNKKCISIHFFRLQRAYNPPNVGVSMLDQSAPLPALLSRNVLVHFFGARWVLNRPVRCLEGKIQKHWLIYIMV